MFYPKVIMGGMGVNISDWSLARLVSILSSLGRETLGTLSGVALERVLAMKLKKADKEAEEIVRILRTYFPFPGVADRVIARYWDKSSAGIPVVSVRPSRAFIELVVCANFAFVKLAKEGHSNPISINYLEKIAMPHLFAIFGAMLASVDFITMGAGIPFQIPAVITAYLEGRSARYNIPVIGAPDYEMTFDPKVFFGSEVSTLKRPGFIPIISSNVLALALLKRLPSGSIYGFVVEEPTAGGHNAPPRNKVAYGEKDIVDYAKLAALGIPFWIGGSYSSPEKLAQAIALGAKGIQVGSIFALAEESGMEAELRRTLRKMGWNGTLHIETSYRVSPTGFPFKLAMVPGTIAFSEIYMARKRVCDQGALVSAYLRADGSIGYRCASEPEGTFVRKGGLLADTVRRGCVCNFLISTAGLGFCQSQKESAGVTLGDDIGFLKHLMADENILYTAKDAVEYLFSGSV